MPIEAFQRLPRPENLQLRLCNILHFGIDTVRFNFRKEFDGVFFDQMMSGLSLNSPQKLGVEFLGELVDVVYAETREKCILNISNLGDAIICIEKRKAQTMGMEIVWQVTFYGTYFYLPELRRLLPKFVLQYKSSLTVSRLDLCMDVDSSVNELWWWKRTKAQKMEMHAKGDRIETFYLGPRKNNKRHFIRVYDKKLDSKKKGKYHVFSNYLLMQEVARIELQMNIMSVQLLGCTPALVVEAFLKPVPSALYEVFRKMCLNVSQTDFENVDVSKAFLKLGTKPKRTLDVLRELPYAATMLGYAKRLKGFGFDPIAFLQAELK